MAEFLCNEWVVGLVISGIFTIAIALTIGNPKNNYQSLGLVVVLLVFFLFLLVFLGVKIIKVYCPNIQKTSPPVSTETTAPPAVGTTEPPAVVTQIISPTVTFQAPTDAPTAQPKPTTQPATAVPSYPHVTKSAGSDIFSSVQTSDGMRPLKQDTLNTSYPGITLLNGKSDGCGQAEFDSSYIWFGGTGGTTLTINGVVMGTLSDNTGSHGVLIKHPVKNHDVLCAKNVQQYMYTLNVGSSDVIAHYDSYCYRRLCKE